MGTNRRQAKRKGTLARGLHRFRKNSLSLAGLGIILVMIILAVSGPYIVPYPEDATGAVHFKSTYQPPSSRHLLGTDGVGRDVLSRIIVGTRVSLMLGVIVLSLAVGIGTPLGLLAGYYGGFAETIIMRITDVFLSVPPIVLALAVSVALKPSLQGSMFAISFAWWPWYTRLIQGMVLSRDYVFERRGLCRSE